VEPWLDQRISKKSPVKHHFFFQTRTSSTRDRTGQEKKWLVWKKRVGKKKELSTLPVPGVGPIGMDDLPHGLQFKKGLGLIHEGCWCVRYLGCWGTVGRGTWNGPTTIVGSSSQSSRTHVWWSPPPPTKKKPNSQYHSLSSRGRIVRSVSFFVAHYPRVYCGTLLRFISKTPNQKEDTFYGGIGSSRAASLSLSFCSSCSRRY
jgi:hypothetical protein